VNSSGTSFRVPTVSLAPLAEISQMMQFSGDASLASI
jgi:hypothetical protein